MIFARSTFSIIFEYLGIMSTLYRIAQAINGDLHIHIRFCADSSQTVLEHHRPLPIHIISVLTVHVHVTMYMCIVTMTIYMYNVYVYTGIVVSYFPNAPPLPPIASTCTYFFPLG
jgi:hypothetical protein